MANYQFTSKSCLSFNDITLAPRFSALSSRMPEHYDTTVEILPGLKLATPLISANMDCVTNANMSIWMRRYGGLGILHRFYASNEERMKEALQCECISIGTSTSEIEFAFDYIDQRAGEYASICIDIAHGHHIQVQTAVEKLRARYPSLPIIAGNICTYEAAIFMTELGVDAIKVGIGPSPVCTTRYVTGHGIPQMTAIQNVCGGVCSDRRRWKNGIRPKIIADGGLKSSGDIVKAIAVGADAIMSGSLFVSTHESAAQKLHIDGQTRVIYRGQSSHEIQKDNNKFRPEIAAEGIVKTLDAVRPLSEVFDELMGGIRSGLSYSGVNNLQDLAKFAEIYQVSHHGYTEGLPNHGQH